MNGPDISEGVFREFAAKLREQRLKAQEEDDAASVARYDAMQAVLRTKLVPLVCPDAVTLAGEAARAACEGRAEGEWLQSVCRERDKSGEDRVALFKAVRLLKTVGIWPWALTARQGRGGAAARAIAGAAPDGDAEQSRLGLEV
jgi:hypothetical protein